MPNRKSCPEPCSGNMLINDPQFLKHLKLSNVDGLMDYGWDAVVISSEKATERNNNHYTALWTGKHLQYAVMKLNPGEDIGLKMYPGIDQFLEIEQGQGMVMMGPGKGKLNFQKKVCKGCAVLIPAGTWHNLINIGRTAFKLLLLYAPPHFPFGTVYATKQDVKSAEARQG